MKAKTKVKESVEWDSEAFREKCRKLRDLALSRGWNGKLLTRKEKEKFAKEYLKEKGLDKLARKVDLYK
ncbi:MAG: hypothetical protein V1847_02685 [Candidatus Diapherotrites archaeon]